LTHTEIVNAGFALNSPAPGENLIEVQALCGPSPHIAHAGKERDNSKIFVVKFFWTLRNSS
jgi:hypothetical protein